MNSSHHMSMTLFQMRLKSFLMFMFYKQKLIFKYLSWNDWYSFLIFLLSNLDDPFLAEQYEYCLTYKILTLIKVNYLFGYISNI